MYEVLRMYSADVKVIKIARLPEIVQQNVKYTYKFEVSEKEIAPCLFL